MVSMRGRNKIPPALIVTPRLSAVYNNIGVVPSSAVAGDGAIFSKRR